MSARVVSFIYTGKIQLHMSTQLYYDVFDGLAEGRIPAVQARLRTVDYSTGHNITMGNHDEMPQGRLMSYTYGCSKTICASSSFARMMVIIIENLLIHNVSVVFCVRGALRH